MTKDMKNLSREEHLLLAGHFYGAAESITKAYEKRKIPFWWNLPFFSNVEQRTAQALIEMVLRIAKHHEAEYLRLRSFDTLLDNEADRPDQDPM